MTVCTFGQYSSSDLRHDVCTAKSEPLSHNSVRKERCSLYLGSLSLCAFSQKATPSMIQDKKSCGFVLYLFSPNTFHHQPCVVSLSPNPVLSILRGAAPRWRSPRLQRKTRPRWAWARAGRSEPSAGTRGSAGPLSRLAPGGCAGSWRPR